MSQWIGYTETIPTQKNIVGQSRHMKYSTPYLNQGKTDQKRYAGVSVGTPHTISQKSNRTSLPFWDDDEDERVERLSSDVKLPNGPARRMRKLLATSNKARERLSSIQDRQRHSTPYTPFFRESPSPSIARTSPTLSLPSRNSSRPSSGERQQFSHSRPSSTSGIRSIAARANVHYKRPTSSSFAYSGKSAFPSQNRTENIQKQNHQSTSTGIPFYPKPSPSSIENFKSDVPIPDYRKVINSYILPPKPISVSEKGQEHYLNLVNQLANDLNKQKHIVERKEAILMELRDDNRENLALLSGIPEKVALSLKLKKKQHELENEVAALEEKSIEAVQYMLTLKLLEERNLITTADIKRRINELERKLQKFEGVCQKVTSESLRVHNQTLEHLNEYQSTETKLLRDREYKEQHCSILKDEIIGLVQHQEDCEHHSQHLKFLAKTVRDDCEAAANYMTTSRRKKQTAYILFGKQMEAYEAKRSIEHFEKVIEHIQISTGLMDYEQVYEYLTTFKGKTENLKALRDDAESRIVKLKKELTNLEQDRDGVMHVQVTSLDKMASHLDKPIQHAEERYLLNQEKCGALQQIFAQVSSAFEAIKDKVAPIVPHNVLTPYTSNAVTNNTMSIIHEDADGTGDITDFGANINESYNTTTDTMTDGSNAGIGSTATNNVLNYMMQTERVLNFTLEIVSNPQLQEEINSKPASRRRPASIINSMNMSKEDNSIATGNDTTSTTNVASSSQSSVAAGASRRTSNVTQQEKRDRRPLLNNNTADNTNNRQSNKTIISNEILSSIDVTKVPISENNVRVPLDQNASDDEESFIVNHLVREARDEMHRAKRRSNDKAKLKS